MTGLEILAGGVLGAVAGSFLSTLVLRWPRGESAAKGRSRCDGCGKVLRWHELVPLLSGLLHRQRCGQCGARIDPLHPAMELAGALTGAWCFAWGQPGLAPLVWLLLALAVIDLRHLWLPDRLVLATAIAALLAPGWPSGDGLALRLGTGAAGFAVLWLASYLFRRVTGRNGLGGGDPKLFGALGLWTGPLLLSPLLLWSCMLGLAHAATRLRASTDIKAEQFPFGTYMALAAISLALARPWLIAG
jgi:leader peptidase (prepilin peptidase)/N-methyltransferase